MDDRYRESIFTLIYKENAWGNPESLSGLGSTLEQTHYVRKMLPHIFEQYEIRSMLDIPCGDFNWMKHLSLNLDVYIGADLVEELTLANQNLYGTNDGKISFQSLDIVTDDLPKVDLVFCRDCLVHLCFEEIFWSIMNLINSGSTFLLTTTFPSLKSNDEVTTGLWRPLNLMVDPFNFPDPIFIFNENSTIQDDFWQDKSLGLWRLIDLL